MVVKDNAKDFEKIPTGLQPAICHSNVDIGERPGFQGKVQHKVVLVFELLETQKEGERAGKRFVVTNTYTAGLNAKSNLSKDLESWRGAAFTPEQRAGFDLDKLNGKPCTLNMIEKEKADGSGKGVYVGSILPKLKTSPDAQLENPPDFIPSWIKKLISGESPEVSGADNFDDDIPF